MIIWEGPSTIDKAPITVLAAFNSNNRKTGPQIQLFILRADIEPHQATKTGEDISICGHCPHRHYNQGACYVLPFQAPLSMYRAYKRGSYPPLNLTRFRGASVRFGAYGDPAAVPFHVWQPILDICASHTGYTHQYGRPWFDSKTAQFCQISADTPKQAQCAQRAGHKTFRIMRDQDTIATTEIQCPSDTHDTQCIDCQLCDGQTQNIAIHVHGQRAGRFNNA